MSARRAPIEQLLIALSLSVSVLATGCGSLELSVQEATTLIQEQFPEAQVRVIDARVEEEQGIADTVFNDSRVSFIFGPTDEGWQLEFVEQEGSVYAVGDLEEITETMVFMSELGSALERYKVSNGSYPLGNDSQALRVLMPGYLPADTRFGDAWQRDFTYTSEGQDYTLMSWGPDEQPGTRDDIVLLSGEFVGADRQQ